MKSPTRLTQYSPSRSSKSIISKKSSRLTKYIPPEQPEKKIEPPYFQEDQIRTEIMNRLSKPNISAKQNNHLEKAQSIIADLMERHKRAKQRLKQMKEQNEKQYEQMYTFTPKIQSNSERYDVKGNVIRRNQIWLREKKKKILELKEEVTMQNLKQCTFSPTLKSKKKSEVYLRNRSPSRSLTSKSRRDYSQNYSPLADKQNHQSKKDYTREEYQTAKQNLISRMMNIVS